MSYGFIDFGERAYTHMSSIQTIVDKLNFDKNKWADGFTFQTLRVSGRGKISYATESEEVQGADGLYDFFTSAEEREIVVTAKVTAQSNESYRKGLAKINAYLFERKKMKIRFTDDKDCYYNATIQSVEDGDEESNKQIVEIVFRCSDIFKYTDEKTSTVSSNGLVKLDTDLSIIPEEVVINFSSTSGANDFTLTNSTQDKRIVVNNSGASSTKVSVGFKDNYIRYGNSDTNRLEVLNIKFSDFDTFKINDGDHISVNKPTQSIIVKYKGARI